MPELSDRGRARLDRYEKKMRKKARRNDRWGVLSAFTHYHQGRPCHRDHRLDPYRVGKRTGVHADVRVPSAPTFTAGAGESDTFTIVFTVGE